LDLSEKAKEKPSSNIRDLVEIIHLETENRINEKHPDYVVSFILPANKLLPYQRSTYSQKKRK
jgi:hypothetical protein